MEIGDTWETINTYAFVAGETIITAGFLNDDDGAEEDCSGEDIEGSPMTKGGCL